MDGYIDFEFEANTEASGSCVASLKNEFYVLGGFHHKRQVIFLLKYSEIQMYRYIISYIMYDIYYRRYYELLFGPYFVPKTSHMLFFSKCPTFNGSKSLKCPNFQNRMGKCGRLRFPNMKNWVFRGKSTRFVLKREKNRKWIGSILEDFKEKCKYGQMMNTSFTWFLGNLKFYIIYTTI